MRDALFQIDRNSPNSLQGQIREMLVRSILDGHLLPGAPLPSSRRMAHTLGVSRNTVVVAYQELVDDGYLVVRERSGYYVNEDLSNDAHPIITPSDTPPRHPPDWETRLDFRPSEQQNIVKAVDWPSYPFPFVYGQVDQGLFPLPAWRECGRQALGRRAMDAWTGDRLIHDDPMLVEQIRTRLLPRRGIQAEPEQILITQGAQNALYMVASLLFSEGTRVGLENPGYPDMRNITEMKTRNVCLLPVDGDGLVLSDALADCRYVYVTPSHQFPTTVTMPLSRREALLERAAESDSILIEDDYEFETNYMGRPTPALKSMDRDDRVIYVGSLSKSLFPGLRLGFMVAHEGFIEEARALRRLMFRHPPTVNQRQTALFLSLGHHDALIRRLHREFRKRWNIMDAALRRHLPVSASRPSFGGTSFWIDGPRNLDSEELSGSAKTQGVLIEPGRVHFFGKDQPKNFFRLGFSSIPTAQIEPGIERLSDVMRMHISDSDA